MKSVREMDVTEKKVLVRVDFNVPLDEQRNITDDTRIQAVLPTLKYLLEHNGALILMSHMGRPKGAPAAKYSLAPVAARLGQLLEKEVVMAPDCIGPEVKQMADSLSPGQVLLLENLRFHPEEEKNGDEFARELGKLCDIYINDAFAVSHRKHASVDAVTKYAPQCGAGFLLADELKYFNQAMENPRRPLAAVVGGAKVSSKLGALKNMMARVDKFIIGGAMANTFLKHQGLELGKSLVEADLVAEAGEIMKQANEKGVRFYLPVDAVVADRPEPDATVKIVPVQEIPKDWMVLDIGPATSLLFSQVLHDAKTIVWNGPMGLFEMDAYSRGTMAMVNSVVNAHALTIVGGGDTVVAVEASGLSDRISYISTGGGAFLHLMEGKVLPGVAALERSAEAA
ncbi:MAG: phosphoglycerate kinase [Desulfobacteraceae bacterium]|nr:MAG: phosphoglycerate kinase [Desulfobacteraceae bacterium]